MLADDQSMRSFCLQHGLDNARISAWEQGTTDPSIEQMRQVADGLSLTLGQVLVIAGYGTPDDFGGAEPPPPAPPVASIDYALDHDPDLSDFARRTLREMLGSIRAVESGAADTVRSRSRKRGGRRA